MIGVLAAFAACEPNDPWCDSYNEIIVRFSDDTTEEENLAVIEEREDTILRHAPEIHYFLLEPRRNPEAALDFYWSRDDVVYALRNWCVQANVTW